MLRTSGILVLGLLAAGSPAAHAAIIDENFSGTVVATLDLLPLGGIFDSPIGTPATGFFTFDTAATTPHAGNTSSLATYDASPGTMTLSISDAFGSYTLTNTVVIASITLQTVPGNNAWELYIPRNPADEPISSYFDAGLGLPITGPTQTIPAVPPDGTVNTTALSYFPTVLPPGVGYSQFAVVNDPANKLSYVEIEITALGNSPEPATFWLVGLMLVAGLKFRPKRR